MLFATHVVTLYEAPETFHPTLILKLSDLAFRIQLFGQQRSNFIDQGELNLRAMIKFSLDSLDMPQYEFIHQDFVFSNKITYRYPDEDIYADLDHRLGFYTE